MSDATFNAMSAPHYLTTMYNDLRPVLFSYTGAGSNPPTFTKYGGTSTSQGVFSQYFAGGSNGPPVERELYMNPQLPHDYSEGTVVTPHIHYAIDTVGSGTMAWGFEYTYAAIGKSLSTTTSIIYVSKSMSGLSTNTHYVLDFPDIAGDVVGKELGISSILMCRLFRGSTAGSPTDSYAGGVYLLDFDLHYISNTPGSRQTTVK